mgnify:CR=1 FL=1
MFRPFQLDSPLELHMKASQAHFGTQPAFNFSGVLVQRLEFSEFEIAAIKVVLQKKKKVFGMWTWNKTGEFSYPSLFHYYTNIKSSEIDFHVKKDLVDNIKLIGKDDDNLKKELIDKKMSIDLFSIKNESFELLSDGIPVFFKIPVKLPKNSPAGKYLVSMNLMDQGSKFETKKIQVFIEKPGISSFVFEFAHKFSFLYGIFSAIIAIALGITAGFIFKKN